MSLTPTSSSLLPAGLPTTPLQHSFLFRLSLSWVSVSWDESRCFQPWAWPCSLAARLVQICGVLLHPLNGNLISVQNKKKALKSWKPTPTICIREKSSSFNAQQGGWWTPIFPSKLIKHILPQSYLVFSLTLGTNIYIGRVKEEIRFQKALPAVQIVIYNHLCDMVWILIVFRATLDHAFLFYFMSLASYLVKKGKLFRTINMFSWTVNAAFIASLRSVFSTLQSFYLITVKLITSVFLWRWMEFFSTFLLVCKDIQLLY